MKNRSIVLWFAISTIAAVAQNDSAAWYYPLQDGNEWLFENSISSYSFMQPTVTTVSFFTRAVAGDTMINEKRYTIISEQDLTTLQKTRFFDRFDSLSGAFYRRLNSTEDMLDSIFCQTPNMTFNGMKMKFIGAAADTFIGSPTHTRTTQLNVTGATIRWSFSHGIGVTKETDWGQDIFFGSSETHTLVHAKINGKEYGTKNILMADSLSLYHPLQTGNKWIYKTTSYNPPSEPTISYFSREVTGDTIIGTTLYKRIAQKNGAGNITGKSSERFDNITGNYIVHNIFGPVIEDSVAANVVESHFGSYGMRKLASVSTDSIFGAARVQREIRAANHIAENEMGWVYAYGIGRIKHYIKELDPSPHGIMEEELVYAKINNIEYGAEPLSVNDEHSILPANIALYQNYPNPFNPSTTISFDVPAALRGETVSLRIIDMLGRDIRTLVNEPVTPGRHTVRFDATGLATGLYFYHIQSGTFVDTKKMMYIK